MAARALTKENDTVTTIELKRWGFDANVTREKWHPQVRHWRMDADRLALRLVQQTRSRERCPL